MANIPLADADVQSTFRFFLSDAEHGTIMPSQKSLQNGHSIGIGGALRQRDLSAAAKLYDGLRSWNAIQQCLQNM